MHGMPNDMQDLETPVSADTRKVYVVSHKFDSQRQQDMTPAQQINSCLALNTFKTQMCANLMQDAKHPNVA